MEHEVFVPVPAERLREVLDDPARVARAVPGLQQDAGAEPVAGRLKIRVGSHSVTYRGAVRVSRRDDDAYAVEGEAEESRGSGSVKLSLRIALRAAEGGCTVVYDGTASADGRIKDLPADAVESAVTRLLNRFAEHLAAAATGPDDEAPTPPPPPPSPAPSGQGTAAEAEEKAPADPGLTEEPPATPERPSVSGADVPPSSLGPEDGQDQEDDEGIAEAAHARRTMIGRSAEEVDHAPPRGRYAPVPAPQTVTPPAPLRWAAPAAALAVASAIVAVRALRRRR
ncbi:Carbon monoxide dehydrogenase subunit G [Streptomyces sp. Ag82_O1-12]|uniref:SRPBCC domain-containing protein n=1 Tax=unclassified Streptomyces TaxID=2593676 RepID=UPI000BC89EAB|nr:MULTISPECIES: SRPBCC domain-containing protein [unclassified Streptomyces]SMQ17832.1 Carbon monoxide dehydrogenase subunit G [Streptomyces sp. Ag82_O1-12]SOD46870.1 Carbon monoxide dehydrogenase subunit G [Streptomyces sp. Ag82_G6-1]